MRRFSTRLRILGTLAAIVLLGPLLVWAAAPNFPALGSDVSPLVFHITSQHGATKTNIVGFNAPYRMRLLWATAHARAKGGIHNSSHGITNVTIFNAGSAATSAMDLGAPAAATVVEATMVAAQQNVAKDAKVTADLAIWGGQTPTLDDVTIVLWVQRRN